MGRTGWTATALLLAGGTAAAQDAPTMHVRGAIAALEGDRLRLVAEDGASTTVHLSTGFAVTAVVPAKLADVKPGDFVGTASVPGAGGEARRALELVVFPEALRGAGEGHRAWDLGAGSTMTNATVRRVTAAPAGRTLELAYTGGSQAVEVPVEAPVVTLAPGDAGLLVPGARVFLAAKRQPDGGLAAERVAVGRDGLVPPM